MSRIIPTMTSRTPRPPSIKRRKVVVSILLDPLLAVGVPLLLTCVGAVVGVAGGTIVGVGVGVMPGVGVAACVIVRPVWTIIMAWVCSFVA
jgi:hypothetical protein